jgi:hypothetical protein
MEGRLAVGGGTCWTVVRQLVEQVTNLASALAQCPRVGSTVGWNLGALVAVHRVGYLPYSSSSYHSIVGRRGQYNATTQPQKTRAIGFDKEGLCLVIAWLNMTINW